MASHLPYYPLYVYDFDDDPNVLSMNLAEVGLYQLALNESWKRGSIPADPKALAVLIRRKPAEVCRAWPKVLPCWIDNGKPGTLINPRQERERAKALEKSFSATKAANVRHANAHANALPYASESGSPSGTPYSQVSSEDKSSTRACDNKVEFDSMMHRWNRHRGFKKPTKPVRERAAEKWNTVEIGDVDLDLSMDGYYASDWAKEQGYPLLGFVKDPWVWITEDSYTLRVNTPAAPQSSAPSAEVTLHWQSDTLYGEYLFSLADRGKRITEPEAEKAFVIWGGLTEEQKCKTIADAKYLVSITDDPKFIPRPTKHLGERPWNAIRREVQILDKGAMRDQKARAILDRMNPSGSEGRVPLR